MEQHNLLGLIFWYTVVGILLLYPARGVALYQVLQWLRVA